MATNDSARSNQFPRAIQPVANFRPGCREMAQFKHLRPSDTHYGYPSPNGSDLTDLSGNET
jgi:hypothetical protein